MLRYFKNHFILRWNWPECIYIYIALFFLSSPPDSIHYAKTLERIECEERLDYAYAQNIYDDRTETHFTGLWHCTWLFALLQVARDEAETVRREMRSCSYRAIATATSLQFSCSRDFSAICFRLLFIYLTSHKNCNDNGPKATKLLLQPITW